MLSPRPPSWDRHNLVRRYSLDFKKVDVGDTASPRLLSGRITHREPLQPSYFSGVFDPDGTVMKQPTDMFGTIIGPKILPDEKDSPRWPGDRPVQTPRERPGSHRRRHRSIRMAAQSDGMSNPTPPAQRRDAQGAPKSSTSDEKCMSLQYVPLSFTIQRQERDYKPEASSAEPTPRFRDPTTARRGRKTFDKPVEPVDIEPRSNVQANPHGILPPDTSRHEQRKKSDKVYTCRQHFSLRVVQPPESEGRQAKVPPGEEDQTVDLQSEEPHGQQNEDAKNQDVYKDFSEGPYRPNPEHYSRRVVKQMVQDKMRWCRYQPDGKGNYVLRAVPEKLIVPKEPPVHHKKKFVELNKASYGQNKESRNEEKVKKEKERALDVARRKEEKEAELKQWQDTVSARVDEAKTRTRRASVIAIDPAEIQAVWLKHCVQAKAVQVFLAVTAKTRAEREARMRTHAAALNIQSFVRGKVMARKMIQWVEQLRELTERIRPTAFFMLRRFRIRQKQRKADVLRVALKEHMQTNRVKRSISNFIFNVRRLQNVWRLYLKRERARMALLSRQWERAFTYIRTKGKAGRLGAVAPAGMRGGGQKKGLRFSGAPPAHGHAAAEVRIAQHNELYIAIPQKQVGLLGRLPQYPALKWVTLREELKRMRRAHLQRVHQYKLEMAEHQAFIEQKSVVETVLVGFAEDQESAHVLTEKLLGDMQRGAVPEAPRLHPVLPARKVQEFILVAVQTIMADFNRQFFDNDAPDDQPAASEKLKPSSPPRHKPWWVLHESYGPPPSGTRRHASPFRASSPIFRAAGKPPSKAATVASPPDVAGQKHL